MKDFFGYEEGQRPWFTVTYRLTKEREVYRLSVEVVSGIGNSGETQRKHRDLASVTSREAANAVIRLFDVEEYEDLTNGGMEQT